MAEETKIEAEEEEDDEAAALAFDDDASSAVEAVTQGRGSLRVKHLLENRWTFWFDNPSGKSRQVAWGSTIRPIHTFSTVEDFWGVYNNVRRPSKLVVGADFHCFKYGIEPKWEDPICAHGGKWTVSCPKGKADTWWLYTLLAMIGEQFEHGDYICGVVVNVRAKQEKISLWTQNGSDEAAQASIGKQWKELLDYKENIGFILHDDAKKHDRFTKSRYLV
ncbi:putative translation Initiation factor eIF-4e, eukaryotic translation initiation factor 4E (eIF-4E) [Dioscorea sansibarensis]